MTTGKADEDPSFFHPPWRNVAGRRRILPLDSSWCFILLDVISSGILTSMYSLPKAVWLKSVKYISYHRLRKAFMKLLFDELSHHMHVFRTKQKFIHRFRNTNIQDFKRDPFLCPCGAVMEFIEGFTPGWRCKESKCWEWESLDFLFSKRRTSLPGANVCTVDLKSRPLHGWLKR